MPTTVKELKSEVLRLLEENKMLRDKVDSLTNKLKKS
jgi:regulator of replication initiation timing